MWVCGTNLTGLTAVRSGRYTPWQFPYWTKSKVAERAKYWSGSFSLFCHKLSIMSTDPAASTWLRSLQVYFSCWTEVRLDGHSLSPLRVQVASQDRKDGGIFNFFKAMFCEVTVMFYDQLLISEFLKWTFVPNMEKFPRHVLEKLLSQEGEKLPEAWKTNGFMTPWSGTPCSVSWPGVNPFPKVWSI